MIAHAERTGLGVSIAAHVAVFGVLSLGLIAAPKPLLPTTQPIDVQIVDKIGLTDTAPVPRMVEPAPSVAPDVGPPEPAAPPEPQAVAPRTPSPPTAPPKPTQVAKPVPAKPVPVKLAPLRPSLKPLPAKPALQPPRGSRLGTDFLRGISDRPTAGTSQIPRAVAVGPAQLAGLASAIRRQVQPCADRITSPGPGAERIATKINLKMNRDGSFAASPAILSQSTDDDNARYGSRVGELAKAAFIQCSPFELPPELYDGWKNIVLNYKLPG